MTDPQAAWSHLPLPVRRAVARSAWRGEHHPHREVADTAYVWAEARMREQDWGLLGAVADVLSGAPSGIWDRWVERRLAKRLIGLGPPEEVAAGPGGNA